MFEEKYNTLISLTSWVGNTERTKDRPLYQTAATDWLIAGTLAGGGGGSGPPSRRVSLRFVRPQSAAAVATPMLSNPSATIRRGSDDELAKRVSSSLVPCFPSSRPVEPFD